jgi:hypothetical protein
MEYQVWIDEIFNRKQVDEFDLDWSDDFCDRLYKMEGEEILRLISLTFEQSGTDLMPFSDVQASFGINFLTNETRDPMHAVYDINIPLAIRRQTIESFVPLYRDFFTKRCDDCFSSDTKNPLNTRCYKLWYSDHPDIYCFLQGNGPDANEMCETFIDMLEKILFIPHTACQESALHGLGHSIMRCSFSKEYPKSYSRRMLVVIDQNLQSSIGNKNLIQYAKQAKTGQIQ